MDKIVIVHIVVYIICVIISYKGIQKSTNFKDFFGFIYMITPMINILTAFIAIVYYIENHPKMEKVEKLIDWNKFFNKF